MKKEWKIGSCILGVAFILTSMSGCSELCGFVTCEDGFTCNPETLACDADADPCDDVVCDDNDGCTTDACVDGVCEFSACGDNEECVEDACVPVIVDLCEGVDCDDDDACTDDTCDAGDCSNEPVACSDGLTCVEGDCVDLCADNACDDEDACTADSCDSATGDCSNEAVICDEGLDCDGGECVDLCVDVECGDEDACTEDSCSHGECANDAIVCDDGHACVEGECVDACAVVPFECDAGFICNLGECVEDLCFDGEPVCLEGFSCNAVTGVCDPDDECAALGTVCTGDDVCVEGECVDLCADVTCEVDFTCDHETGECVADQVVKIIRGARRWLSLLFVFMGIHYGFASTSY